MTRHQAISQTERTTGRAVYKALSPYSHTIHDFKRARHFQFSYRISETAAESTCYVLFLRCVSFLENSEEHVRGDKAAIFLCRCETGFSRHVAPCKFRRWRKSLRTRAKGSRREGLAYNRRAHGFTRERDDGHNTTQNEAESGVLAEMAGY